MHITLIESHDNRWKLVSEYARNCSWRAGKSLANKMDNMEFTDFERVVVAWDDKSIAGYCTVAKDDCIKGIPYTPFISFVFVGEPYRGDRLSQKMIESSIQYLSKLGFSSVYLISDHENLYEKYGFHVIDRKIAPWGEEEKIYMRKIAKQTGI